MDGSVNNRFSLARSFAKCHFISIQLISPARRSRVIVDRVARYNVGLRVAECISASLQRCCIHRPDRDRTVVSRSMLHVLDATRSIVAQAVCKLANFRRVARYQKRSLARLPRRNLGADIAPTTLRPCIPTARSSLRFTASLLAEYFRDVKTFVPSLALSQTRIAAGDIHSVALIAPTRG